MATKKTTGAKAPKATEKQVEQTVPATENKGTQYRIPFITAKIDRMSTDPNNKIKANASVTIGNHFAIYQNTESVLKRHRCKLRIVQLFLELSGHDTQTHILQFGNCFVGQHYLSLL